MRRVQELLKKRGVATFLDCQDLSPGLPWGQELERALRSVRAVAVFLGPNDLGDWQKREIGFALDRQVREERQGLAFPVIPVLLEGAKLEHSFLLQNTWVDLRDDLTSPKGIQLLVEAVQGKDLAVQAEALAEFCPYRSLKSFREEDAAFFCGRDAFTKNLLQVVLSRDLVAIVGDSGSGKSSVIHAGLLPALRRRRPPDTWDAISCTPKSDPFYELAASIIPLLEPDMTKTDRLIENRKLGVSLAEGQTRLEDVLALVLEMSRGTDRLLIIIDQFEELFTLTPGEVQRPFVEMLLRARTLGRCSLLLSLRGEFYGRTLGLSRELSDRVQNGIINVGPMTPEELKQAITEPARRVGLEFEAGLDTAILDDAFGQPGNLPLLEFALSELWKGRDGNLLTHTCYEEIGGVVGAIAKTADGIFDSFDLERQEITRHVFTQLVRVARPEEGAVDTRRRALRSELGPWAEAALVDEVIDKLANKRLITITRGAQEKPLGVELAHEALLQKWPTLESWINGERGDLITHRWLADEAAGWEASSHEPSYLLSGARMKQARGWVKRHPEKLTDLERAFLRESITAIEISERQKLEQDEALKEALAAKLEAERRRTEEQTGRYRAEKKFSRKLSVAVVALIAISLLAIGSAWYSYVQKRKATWRNLLLKSDAVLASQPQLSLLLALEALKLEEEHSNLRPASAEDTLRQALANFIGKPLGMGAIHGTAVSPDHRWLATAGAGKRIMVWDLAAEDPAKSPTILHGQENRASKIAISRGGRFVATFSTNQQGQTPDAVRLWDLRKKTADPVFLLPGEDWLGPTPFSPDGGWLVTREFGLRVRELKSRNPARHPPELAGNPTALAFSPRGHALATGDLNGTVRVWNLANPLDTPQNLAAPGGATRALAFSPDGGWLISAGAGGSVTGWRWSEAAGWSAPIPFHGCGGALGSLEIDPGGTWLFGWGRSPSACLWKLTEPAALACPLLGSGGEEITAATFNRGPGRSWLFTAQKETVRRWDLQSNGCGQLAWKREGPPVTLLASTDGKRLLISGMDQTPRLLNLAKDNPFDPDEPRVVRTPGGPFTVALSSDGNSLAAGQADGKIFLRDLERQATGLIPLQGQEEPVTALAFSPDRTLLASGGKGGAILLWNLAGRNTRPAAAPRRLEDSVTALAFSLENRWLVAGGAALGRSLSWKLPAMVPAEWDLINHPGSVSAVAFSRDGRWLVTAGEDGQARAYPSPSFGAADPALLPNEHRDGITAMALSRDGRWLVTAGADGPAWLWSLPLRSDSDPIPLPREYTGALTALAFSPDGRQLASGGHDRTVRLWSLEPQGPPQPSAVLHVQEQEIRAIAFSPDGHWLITVGADGTARRWNLHLDELKRLACEKAGRNLTQEEWNTYISSESYQETEPCPEFPKAFD